MELIKKILAKRLQKVYLLFLLLVSFSCTSTESTKPKKPWLSVIIPEIIFENNTMDEAIEFLQNHPRVKETGLRIILRQRETTHAIATEYDADEDPFVPTEGEGDNGRELKPLSCTMAHAGSAVILAAERATVFLRRTLINNSAPNRTSGKPPSSLCSSIHAGFIPSGACVHLSGQWRSHAP